MFFLPISTSLKRKNKGFDEIFLFSLSGQPRESDKKFTSKPSALSPSCVGLGFSFLMLLLKAKN